MPGSLLLKTLHGVVAVPSNAVQRGAPGTFVYLVGADDTVSARTVSLGPLDGDKYAVNSGLSLGDRVVVDGADRLRDGAKVLIPASGNASDGRPMQPADGETPAKNVSSKKDHRGGHSGQPDKP
jgi:multidrug efflux system membrane fusion protein